MDCWKDLSLEHCKRCYSWGVKDWIGFVSFGAAVGGASYLTLQGLMLTPVIGPVLKVGSTIIKNSLKLINKL